MLITNYTQAKSFPNIPSVSGYIYHTTINQTYFVFRLPLLSRYGTSRDSRRWSCHSIPSCPMSSGYITQNSTPPYSACSSSQEKIYCSGVDSVEDLRKCSSLSSSVSSHQLQMEKQDIEDRNIIYREKFPLVREQMESQLEKFIQEEELIEEESCTGGDAVWAFIHKQVIEIARLTLKKSSENSITCRGMSNPLQTLETLHLNII